MRFGKLLFWLRPTNWDKVSEDLYAFWAFVLIAAVFAVLSFFTETAQDATRKQHLGQLKTALRKLAETNNGSFALPAGFNRSGVGWVDKMYDGNPSIIQELHRRDLLDVDRLDDPIDRPGYLLLLCDDNKRFSLWATLDNPSREDAQFAREQCNASGPYGAIDGYKKNYAVADGTGG